MSPSVARVKMAVNTAVVNARRLGENNSKIPGTPVFDHLRPGRQGLGDSVREIALFIRLEAMQYELQLRIQAGYPPDSVLFKGSLWQQEVDAAERIISQTRMAESRGPEIMGAPIASLEPGLTEHQIYHERSTAEILELATVKDPGFLELVGEFNRLAD